MRHRLSLLLAAVLAGSTLTLLGPARPASAAVVCAGNGTATVNPGLLYPVLLGVFGAPAKDHPVDVLIGKASILHAVGWLFAPGACVHPRVPPTILPFSGFGGMLKGYCGHASGFGTLAGQAYAFVQVGTLLVFTGHIVAVGNITATTVSVSGQCVIFDSPFTTPFVKATGGETTFEFQLAGVGLNCANPKAPTAVLGPTIVQNQSPTPTVGVHATVGVHLFVMPPCTTPSIVLP